MASIVGYINFQKFSGRACPQTPLELFLFSIGLYFEIILQKKNTLENMANLDVPCLKKFLDFSANIKTFQRAFYAFFGSNVFVLN